MDFPELGCFKAFRMDKYGLAVMILTFSIISSTSNAYPFSNFRKLIADPPINNSSTPQVSPTPNSVTGGDNSDLKPSLVSVENSGKEKSMEAKMDANNKTDEASAQATPSPVSLGDNSRLKASPVGTKNSVKEKPMDAKTDVNNETDAGAAKSSPPARAKKSVETAGEKYDLTKSQLKNEGSCDGLSNWCRDQKDILACIEMSQNGSKEMFLVVQNKGEGSLTVNIDMLSTVGNTLPVLDIPKHQSRRINISAVLKATKVTLNAGSGECVLPLGLPVSVEDLFQQLSFYSKQVTPISVAYFVFLVALLLGGTWTCCRLSRRRHEGVPYQELEMGLPESSCAANVDTAEGWDQDWDDDWDNNDVVTSPNGHHSASISSNGLTARTSRKEGWVDDWED